jgi:tyrosine-protein kinase Etk/Wzc
MANISVVQVASVPAKPIKPKKRLNIFLGMVLGGVTGLGLAFLSEYTGQGLSTPASAENRLGLPVLTTVSYKKRMGR